MEKPLYINRDKQEEPSLDYDFLRAEGIKNIQELSGAFWTDYNEHDPGVTILEQVCYALTDLAYRTNFDIQDHLFNDKKTEQSFFKANQILPCNPVTIDDYRKKIFDSVFEIKNVWLSPIAGSENTLNGLYKILLYLNEDIKDEKVKKNIVDKIRDVYCENRNIGEDVELIKLLDPLPFTIHANIETDGTDELENILANIYFLVDNFISPAIRFYSLEELIEEGYELNEIFNGPLLKHGFIKTSELTPKPDKILVSEIIKIIMQVKGVVSVKNLYIKIGDETFTNQVNIDEKHIPRLEINIKEDSKKSPVSFFKGSLTYANVDYDLVKRKLNEIQSVNTRVYRLSEETIEIPKGRELKIEEYYSFQNQFPLNYGISSYGVPQSGNKTRLAQAKQLKGYLMIFEQLMVNYLSQLSNAKNLFSIKGEDNQTYFYQTLEKVPDAGELFKNTPDLQVNDPLIKEMKLPLDYKKGLDKLVKLNDNYLDRRNRFLDYLLALHGESYKQYTFSQFNYYFSDEEFELHHIETKKRLLEHLPEINSNRAKGFNYRKSTLNSNNQAGMESKISVLLGLGIGLKKEDTGENQESLYTEESLTEHYRKHNITLLPEEAPKSKKRLWDLESRIENTKLSPAIIEEHFDLIDDEELEEVSYDENRKKELLQKTLPFLSKTLMAGFLREGIDLYKYKVGTLPDTDSPHFVVFKNEQENTWLLTGTYDNKNDASIATMELIHYLKHLNIKSEGMQLLEHILLRPDVKDKKFGFYMLDETGKPFLKSTSLYNFSDRLKTVERLKEFVTAYNNYSVESTPEKDFQVQFSTPDGSIKLISIEARESVEETHDRMEGLFRFMSDSENIVPYTEKIAYYIQGAQDMPHLPEDFYSCRISIMLPDWTTRLNDKEFRSIVENTLIEHRPSNISSRCFWLSPQEMEEFENYYYGWMSECAKSEDAELLEKLKNDLLRFLIRMYNQNR
ncbi:MAG: hypothetical protein ACK4ND_03855 [Cytophagaceae bacterium]